MSLKVTRNRWGWLGLALLTLIFTTNKALAQSCNSLDVVGGEGYVVEKTVTVPSVPIGLASLFNNNWNTDFSVPSNVNFNRYVGKLIPLSNGEYTIRMYLKYSDGTADEAFNQVITLSKGKAIEMTGSPRKNQQPYQVNIFVGDLNSVGKSFKISVVGCR